MKHLKKFNESNEYQKLDLVPEIYAGNFSSEMEMECAEHEVNTHYQADTLHIDWDDPNDMPKSQEWLLNTYGPVVKEYGSFSIVPT